MFKVVLFSDDLFFATKALEDLTQFAAVEFVGLNAKVSQRLPVIQLQNDVGHFGKSGAGSEGNQSFDGILQRLVATFREDGNEAGRRSDTGGGTAHSNPSIINSRSYRLSLSFEESVWDLTLTEYPGAKDHRYYQNC